MTITWESPVTEVVWESQTAPGITWTTVVGGTEIPARRLLPNTVGTPGQTVVVNAGGTAVEYVDAATSGGAVDSVNGQTGTVVLTAADVGTLDSGGITTVASGYAADALSDANDYTDTAVAGKQAADADLTAIAALAPSDDALIQRKAGAWTSRTPAQVKADMSIGVGDVSGLDENTRDVIGAALVAGSGVAVTVDDPGNTITLSIADGSVTNTKLANMAAKTFKGRHTNSTGAPEDVTAANLLADLIAAAGTPTGLKFIRDDGTLATPPGGSNYSTRTFARRTFI